jgi:tRNA-dihydrouridine synthase
MPSFEEIFAVLLEHAKRLTITFGEQSLVRMRKHAMWYCAGLPGASHFRRQINGIKTMVDMELLIEDYRAFLST